MAERWLPVVGYEASYEVSDHGRVRSVPRTVRVSYSDGRKHDRRYPGTLLKPGTVKSGHQIVFLGRGHPKLIHALVLKAFVGPRPDGQEGCHGDGDAGNNFLWNLRWGTRAENIQDSVAHGTAAIGDKHPMAVLSSKDIPLIRKLRLTHTRASVARMYGVSPGAIQGIDDGRNWRMV